MQNLYSIHPNPSNTARSIPSPPGEHHLHLSMGMHFNHKSIARPSPAPTIVHQPMRALERATERATEYVIEYWRSRLLPLLENSQNKQRSKSQLNATIISCVLLRITLHLCIYIFIYEWAGSSSGVLARLFVIMTIMTVNNVARSKQA